jgi:hypothetical protein
VIALFVVARIAGSFSSAKDRQGRIEKMKAQKQSANKPTTTSENQKKFRGKVARKDLHKYLKTAMSSVTGGGDDDIELGNNFDAVLKEVAKLDKQAKGFNWKTDAKSPKAFSVQMMYLSGEGQEESWAVAVDALTKTSDGKLVPAEPIRKKDFK